MPTKMLDLVVHQPIGPLFDPTAQKIVTVGLLIFLLLWGFAKIMKAGE